MKRNMNHYFIKRLENWFLYQTLINKVLVNKFYYTENSYYSLFSEKITFPIKTN